MQPSIAERFTWGRPYDPVAGDTVVPTVPRSTTALVGRILMSAIFIVSGFAKLTDPAGASGYMSGVGIGNADTLVYVAGAAELAGGLAVLFGFLSRIAAIGLIVLLAIIQFYFHNFWALPEPDAKMQMVQFMKNLSIMGGLFMIVAMGPGRYSIDERLRRRRAA
jgi:putative oxidoreductase